MYMLMYLAFHREPDTDESLYGEADYQPDGSIASRVDERSSDRPAVLDIPGHCSHCVVVFPGHRERQRQVDGVVDGQRGQVDVGRRARHGGACEHDYCKEVGEDSDGDDDRTEHALHHEACRLETLLQVSQFVVDVEVEVAAAGHVLIRRRPVVRHHLRCRNTS